MKVYELIEILLTCDQKSTVKFIEELNGVEYDIHSIECSDDVVFLYNDNPCQPYLDWLRK